MLCILLLGKTCVGSGVILPGSNPKTAASMTATLEL
jgi:hypothetical protein